MSSEPIAPGLGMGWSELFVSIAIDRFFASFPPSPSIFPFCFPALPDTSTLTSINVRIEGCFWHGLFSERAASSFSL